MKWPLIRDIVAFRPALDAASASLMAEDFSSEPQENAHTHHPEPRNEATEERWRRIRFDNAIRISVAVPTYLTCVALRAGGAIDSILPLTAVIIGYAAAVVSAFTLFLNTRFSRSADYVLSALDLITMSLAVYLTGATASPLYFVYFVPVVIHAFHRDWNLILFSGFGGVILYGVSVLVSLHNPGSAAIADLFARLVFMLLTVAIACLALSILRKEEARDRRRIARLRATSAIGHELNTACSAAEMAVSCMNVAPLIGAGLSVPAATIHIIFRSSSAEAAQRTEKACPGHFSGQHSPSHECLSECPCGAYRNGTLNLPIAVEGDVAAGMITVTTPRAAPLADEDIHFLRFVARSIALCLRRHQMIEELGRSVEMGTAVAAVYLAAGRSSGAAQTIFLEGAVSLGGADHATLFLWNGNRARLEATAWCGLFPGKKGLESFQAGEGTVGGAYLDRAVKQTIVDETGRREVSTGSGMRALLAAPLELAAGEILGVVALMKGEGEMPFSEEDVALLAAFACRSAHALTPAAHRSAEMAPPSSPQLAA